MFNWFKKQFAWNTLSSAETSILLAMFQGASVRSHRDIEGNKQYLLHTGEGIPPTPIADEVVPRLRERRLIETNHKFPTSTYLLTGRGNQVAETLTDDDGANSLTARDFVRD